MFLVLCSAAASEECCSYEQCSIKIQHHNDDSSIYIYSTSMQFQASHILSPASALNMQWYILSIDLPTPSPVPTYKVNSQSQHRRNLWHIYFLDKQLGNMFICLESHSFPGGERIFKAKKQKFICCVHVRLFLLTNKPVSVPEVLLSLISPIASSAFRSEFIRVLWICSMKKK